MREPRLRLQTPCRLCWILAATTLVMVATQSRLAQAEDPRIAPSATVGTVTDEKRTLLDLYLHLEEARRYLLAHPDMVLIDVRPGPILGMTRTPDLAAGHIPLLIERAPSAELPPDPDLPVAGMRLNPDFAADVERLLKARGLGKDATIMLFCGIGLFSARAADLLAEAGYHNVYSIVDGADALRRKAGTAQPAN